MLKHKQRLRFLAARKALSAETCLALSQDVQQRFLQSDAFRRAGCLALYSAIHNEVRTEEVALQALARNKRLVYPRVRDGVLDFVAVNALEDLEPGYMGVLEPPGLAAVPAEEIDVLVVPGVAFDLRGYRLGYGRGYYDRVLATCHRESLKVGFAYEMQLAKLLPAESHDEALSVLVTERRIINCSAGAPLSEFRL